MTKQEAQVILLRAFLATGELPDNLAALLRALIDVAGTPDSTSTG